MKNISLIIAIFAITLLTYACQKSEACLSPNNDCNCPSGYEGQDCLEKTTSKFVGRYQNDNYTIIRDSAGILNRVFIKYATTTSGTGGFGIYGNVDGDHIIVPRQTAILQFSSDFPSIFSGEICLEKGNDNTTVLVSKLTISYGFSSSPAFNRRSWRKL
jgi:hypothetical protein